ncbi:MAG: glucan biosynthesis protein [Longimicrobiales bacterium]
MTVRRWRRLCAHGSGGTPFRARLRPPRSQRRVVLDFAGGPLGRLAAGALVAAEAQTSSGEVSDLLVHLLPDGGRRATFTLTPDGDRGADMRVYLRLNEQPVSETWSYLWEPPRVP